MKKRKYKPRKRPPAKMSGSRNLRKLRANPLWEPRESHAGSSILGESPNSKQRGPSAASTLNAGDRAMLSRGTPGNEESDP